MLEQTPVMYIRNKLQSEKVITIHAILGFHFFSVLLCMIDCNRIRNYSRNISILLYCTETKNAAFSQSYF